MQSPPNELKAGVREALFSDAPRIVALLLQLGYEVPLAHVEACLGERGSDRAFFVAIVPRVGVVGCVTVSQRRALLANNRAEIESLVVEDEYRGNGIGALLLKASEAWARRRGCAAMRLLSNVVRERAHRFYARSGYDVLKTEHVFQKQL